jgi:type I restriction enzyme S subunit
MSSEWIDTTIGDQVQLQRGVDITKRDFKQGTIPVVSSGGIGGFHDTFTGVAPGVILGRKGLVGSVYYLPADYWAHDTTLWVKDFKGNHPKYVYYFFRSIAATLRDLDVGSANPTLNRNHVHPIETRWAPIAEQKAIAHILGTLDDKIELNRKTNETLEAMAKALFKSWFVDYDPVRAKAEGRPTGLPAEISDLFPDSFEDSELGEIPSGWGTTCLDELTSFVIGGDWGKDAWSETEQAKVLCLRGADIPSLQEFAMGKPPTRFLKESSCEKRILVDGDIVLEISGGSTDQSTGRPVLISSGLIKRAETPLTCSNFCRIIRFDDLRWSSYAYYLMLSLYQSGEMFQYETGTTGIKNFGYKYFAGGRFFPKPPSTFLDIFHCQVKSLHSSCHRRGEESDLLSKTRDALLPKLISGEIRIPDAEKMLEEVGV